MTLQSREQIWSAIHEERRRLADDLAGLDAASWTTPSLCGAWTVKEVLAHLTVGALETRWTWLRSVIRSRFDFDAHNERQLRQQRGRTPAETLTRFREAIDSTSAASGHHWAWLGEIVIHGEDIRRPLGIASPTDPATAAFLLQRFAAKNFTVPSKSAAAGLTLRATDAELTIGDGPEVTGPALSLLLAIAGREVHLHDLDGPGLGTLRERAAA